MKKTAIVVLLAFAAICAAQTDNTVYVKGFPGNDVGSKVTAALNACNPNVMIPCVVVIDPSLAAWPAGSMPNLCPQCILMDYRTTSPILGKNVWTPLQASAFPGADASYKLNACIAAVESAGGGICDARGLTGTQQLSQQVKVGDGTHGVVLLLPGVAEWDTTITNGSSCVIEQYSESSILGMGSHLNRMIIGTSPGSSVKNLYCTDPSPANGGSYIRAEGFQLFDRYGNITGNLMELTRLFDESYFGHISADMDSPGGWAIHATRLCCSTKLEDMDIDGGTLAGGLWIDGSNDMQNPSVIVSDSTLNHPGNGMSALLVSGCCQGTGTWSEVTNSPITLRSIYTELTNAGNSAINRTGLNIQDAKAVSISDFSCSTMSVSGSSGNTCLKLSETIPNELRQIQVSNYQFWSAAQSGTYGFVNSITGESLLTSSGNLQSYSYGGESGSEQPLPNIYSESASKWVNASGVTILTIDPAQSVPFSLSGPFKASSGAGIGSATFAAGPAAGTSPGTPTCASNHICDSVSGTVTMTIGSSPAVSNVILTVTTGITRSNSPTCTGAIVPVSGIALSGAVIGSTTTTVTFNAMGTAAAASTPYTFTYVCSGD